MKNPFKKTVKKIKHTAHATTYYGGRINGETKKFARINKHAAHRKPKS